jgi:hypothetical protein
MLMKEGQKLLGLVELLEITNPKIETSQQPGLKFKALIVWATIRSVSTRDATLRARAIDSPRQRRLLHSPFPLSLGCSRSMSLKQPDH